MVQKSKLTRSTASALRSKSFIGAGSRASARRVWPILIIFLVIIALITGGVITLLRRHAVTSLATTFTSQPLSDEAQASLQVSPLAPEDYLIGGNLDIAGALGVNTITSSADMLVGSQEHAVTLQGSNVSLSATIGGTTNTLRFATPSGTSKTIVVPNASGTIAVSASGPLVLDANGNLSCPSCVNALPISSATTTLNAISGDILLQGTSNQIVVTNAIDGKAITLSLPQDININASPIFANINITQSLQVADIITAGSLTLTAPLAVSSGGTGVSSLLTNGVVVGNGSNALTSITGNNGQCLIVSGTAPVFGACPGAGGVNSINGATGLITINGTTAGSIWTSGGTITINDATASVKGLAAFNGNNFTVTNGVVDTIQGIRVTSTPTFAGLNLTTALAVADGGTGSSTASGARMMLGAAVSGANDDINQLTGLTSINPTSSLVIGAATQSLTLQGAATTLSSQSSGFTTTLSFASPTANATYRLQSAAAGTYDVCTTTGNCVGIGGSVTTAGGTVGRIAKFTAGGAIGDSLINDTGTIVTIDGPLRVTTITPMSAATIGSTTQNLTLQGAITNLTSSAAGSTNTLTFATPSGAAKTITIPNANGTLAVSASGPIELDTNGTLTCPSCLTTGTNGGQAGVTNLNGLTGGVTLTAITPSSILSSSGTITIQDASATTKGLAAFNATNLTVSNGVVNTAQGISVSATPTFAGLNLSSALSVANGGTDLGSTPLAGQLLIGNGSGYSLNTLTAGAGIMIANAPGGITISSPASGTCPSCANQALSNLTSVAINTNLLPGTTNAIDLGSNSVAFRNGYLAGVMQVGSLDAASASSLAIGTTNATTVALGADTTIASGKSLTVNGAALFKNNVNSATAFQIQDSAGVALLNANTSQGTLSVGTYTPTTVYTPTSVTRVDYTTGTSPTSVTTADFNGDGKADLAVANQTSNTVSVFINTGTGSYAAKVDYTTGTLPQSVTTADFNGDGKADLAVANQTSNTVSVFINTGTGTFAAKVDYTTGTGPRAVASADFNGDGKADLAITNGGGSNTVSVLINTGTGTFAAKVDYTTGTLPQSVTTADFNGDGKADLAVANSQSSTVSVLINNGTGTFAVKVDYTTGVYPRAVTSADFNGDGKADLAVTNQNSATVSVFINNGTGTFAAKIDYVTGALPLAITSADFNGDGKADLVVPDANTNTVSVLINSGTGTFAPKVDYVTGGYPQSVSAADFNGDGKVDLATANNSASNMSVILFDGAMTGTVVTQGSSKFMVNATAVVVGHVIQGTSGQTADLLQARNDINTTLFSVGATGNVAAAGTLNVTGAVTAASTLAVTSTLNANGMFNANSTLNASGTLNATGTALFKNSINSITAFQIQQANSTAVFGVDTTNGRVGIGTAAPANKLSVNALTTANATAQVAIGTSAVGNKGLVLQGVTSQTANLFEAQNSTGAVMASIGATGTTLFKNTVDSTTAFQIQASNGAALLTADTTHGSLSVGTFAGPMWYTAAAKVDYVTGSNSQSVTSADFNGDGKADLVVANAGNNIVSVLLGNGDGTFAAKVDYTTGSNPRSVTSADFNSDGKADLAVANWGPGTVSVLLGNGDGTFAAKVDYTTGTQPYSVTSADFNGDGKADLAVANNVSNTTSVFINSGTGTFAAKVDYATSLQPRSVTSADLNGDGKADLVVANQGSNTTSVFINSGTGTFAAKVDYPTGSGPQSVTSADLNGDGKADLVVANQGSNTTSVFINSGTGTFAAKVDYPTGSGPQSVTSADLNGDGKADLVVANYNPNTISVFLGSGTGTFAAKVDYPTGSGPQSVTSADLNGDGSADLAVANGTSNSVSVLMNTSPKLIVNTSASSVGQIIQSASGQTADLLQIKDGTNGTLYSVGATGSVLFKNNANSTTAFQIQQANATAVFGVDTTNGRVGIGTITPANKLSVNALITADTTAQVAIGTGAAVNKGLVLQGALSQTANLFEAQNSSGAVMASIGATGVATFKNNVDSSAALQIQNSSSVVFFNADTTNSTISIGSSDRYTPAAKVDYATGTNPYEVTNADLNGDGKADLAVANNGSNTVSVFMNTGTGTFAAKVDYATGSTPWSVTSADFNGDGKADLAVANSGSNTVSVFMNTGTGTFAAKVDYATGSAPRGVTSADVNGDGKADLIVANGISNTVSVFMNSGNGTFAPKVDYATGTSPYFVTTADFNGDGKADLAVVNSAPNTVSVFMNTGTGTFAAKVDYATGSGPVAVTSADFNGDGKPDLAVANNNSPYTVSILLNTGTGTFAAKVDYATGTFPRSVTSANLNGDGRPDLAIANNGGFVSVHINNGDGTFMAKVDYATGINSMSVTAADFNGDGKPDLAVTNTTTNAVSVFMNTTILSTSAKLTVRASVAAVGQIIQSASGQTADLLQVKDSVNGTLYSVGATGNVLFKNNANSTSAFQVQQASGTAVFSVDTTNGRVGVGTIAPANKLSVNDLTTADAFAQLAIGTGATTNKGLIVQGVLGQTADLLQAQSSIGAVLASIGATGTLTVTSAVVNGTLTVNGHIITSGTVPTVEAGVAACTAPTIFITGNDTSGKVTITTGTGCALTGNMATVTFNGAFGAEPLITLTPNNAQAAQLQLYTNDASISSFTIDTATSTTDATTYKFNYLVVQ